MAGPAAVTTATAAASQMTLSSFKARFAECCAPGAGPAEPKVAAKLTAAVASVRPLSSRLLFFDVGAGGVFLQVCLRADLCGVGKVQSLKVVRSGLPPGRTVCVVGYLGKVAGGHLTLFATRVWSPVEDGGDERVIDPVVEVLHGHEAEMQVEVAEAGSAVSIGERAALGREALEKARQAKRNTEQQYVAFRVAYRGDWKARSGWQRQDAKLESVLPSVQGLLEGALSSVFKGGYAPVVQVSSRTDRGVHALDQLAVVRLPDGIWVRCSDSETEEGGIDCPAVPAEITAGEVVEALNSALPDGIVVLSCSSAGDRRLAVKAKEYWYHFQLEPPSATARKPTPSWRVREAAPYVWFLHESADVARMREALAHMVGTHDFRRVAYDTSQKQPERTLLSASLEEVTPTPDLFELPGEVLPWPAAEGPESVLLVLKVTGTGFLRHMMRRIAGTLKLVGTGKLAAEDVLEILAGRREGGPAAPPCGLCLRRVWMVGEDEESSCKPEVAGDTTAV